jgi:hypothetical protein
VVKYRAGGPVLRDLPDQDGCPCGQTESWSERYCSSQTRSSSVSRLHPQLTPNPYHSPSISTEQAQTSEFWSIDRDSEVFYKAGLSPITFRFNMAPM